MTTGASTKLVAGRPANGSTRPWEAQRQASDTATLLLVTLSAGTLTAARVESSTSWVWLLGTTLVFVGGPWLVRGAFAVWRPHREQIDAFLPIAMVTWAALPFGLEAVSRAQGLGDAPEIIMLVGLQNVALIAAAYAHRQRCQPVACLLSAFLALFAIVISSAAAVFSLAGLFGVMMLWWMMARYWERVQDTLAASRAERCLPVRTSVLGITSVGAVLLGATVGATGGSTYVLRGFMPASGGDRWNDEHARAGVGDGDAMVAAKDEAMSFGPVESELFLDSDMPSLYDMFSDMYGEPPQPKRNQERNIGLAPGDIQETEQQIAQSERSGREFSAVRRPAQRRFGTLEDRTAPAMLYVVGRVPLHLAMQRYDTFDGREWTHSSKVEAHPPIRLVTERDKPWAHLTRVGASPIFRGLEHHALKIINLKTNRFPSPPHVTAIHVDKVDQLDFFGWSGDGVPRMPVRERIPQLTVLHVRSQGVNLQSLRETDFRLVESESGSVSGESRAGPDASPTSSWTHGVPRGWRQVEAIVTRLRSDFVHDPEALAPADCDDVVAHFLRVRRGPDYLFATTAAMLLRSHGYAARLVTGFYARGERFNKRAGQTSVLAEDVHCWVEVNIDGRTWVPIEPTPGYEPPREVRTWPQRIAVMGQRFLAWCLRHALAISQFCLATVVVWHQRVAWCDCLLRCFFEIIGYGGATQRIRATLRLLEWRGWLAGQVRPPEIPIRAWYQSRAAGLSDDTRQDIDDFIGWAERMLYAPSVPPDLHARRAEIVRVCAGVSRRLGAWQMQTVSRRNIAIGVSHGSA